MVFRRRRRFRRLRQGPGRGKPLRTQVARISRTLTGLKGTFNRYQDAKAILNADIWNTGAYNTNYKVIQPYPQVNNNNVYVSPDLGIGRSLKFHLKQVGFNILFSSITDVTGGTPVAVGDKYIGTTYRCLLVRIRHLDFTTQTLPTWAYDPTTPATRNNALFPLDTTIGADPLINGWPNIQLVGRNQNVQILRDRRITISSAGGAERRIIMRYRPPRSEVMTLANSVTANSVFLPKENFYALYIFSEKGYANGTAGSADFTVSAGMMCDFYTVGA